MTPATISPALSEIELQATSSNRLTILILAIVTAPYRRTFYLYTWKPLQEMRATHERRALIQCIRNWKTDKYQELQSVQVAASFCTGITLSTLSWTRNPNPLWVSEALWSSSLVCSIWAVITSIQTKSILDDLPPAEQLTSSSSPSSLLPESEIRRCKRVILRYKKTPGLGHWAMLFIWQFPSMTMAYAWCTFLSGLTIYVCTPFIRREPWSDRHKIAVVYLAVGGIGLVTYLYSSVFVYASEKDFEASAASTRVNTGDLDSSVLRSGIVSDNVTLTDGPVHAVRRQLLGGTGLDRRETETSGRSKKQLLY